MTRGPTVAVFTKNRTNAAYEGARLGADRVAARMGGKAVHYVPDTPDDVEEQVALVDRALAARPDAFVFVPVHLTAMNASILKINAAGIPLAASGWLTPVLAGMAMSMSSLSVMLNALLLRRHRAPH